MDTADNIVIYTTNTLFVQANYKGVAAYVA